MKVNIISEMTGKVYEKTVAEFEKIVPTAHVKDVMSYSTVPESQIDRSLWVGG